ncbi:glutathione peroxidase [Halieaceae bacterium IMCC14734]|uniref:Glutathione peroxidase n=1 Tax=Candidatus Litorirhabdus singularis TaxID=2518993 RepID=A0ABT3TEH1_9GAMM|nr:glutathione peroxidase [Candidatus Litorirhabdus singularis]MCX2980404.1 glutathione peroxidase [Candidatus Litorirhabdus singularis]
MRIPLALVLFIGSLSVQAACPDYLDHSMRQLHSKAEVNLCSAFEGKPMLVINTASHCGYTPQFKGLEAVYQKYKEQGLVVVGFASDDFKQEDDDEAKAADICFVNFGVTFTMLAPSHVRGENANPVFQELARQTRAPSWNFNKYLINAQGQVVEHFGSNTKPESESLQAAIEKVL